MSFWPHQPFGELLSEPVRNGIYKAKEFHGRGWKIVNMGELFSYPRLGNIPMKRVELSTDEQKRFELKSGDLLFARRSLVAEGAGKCCLVQSVDSKGTTFESSIIRARPDPTRVSSVFLYYFFCSPQGKHVLDTIRRQVAVSGITGSDLMRLSVPVPPLHQQHAIAHILSAFDERIDCSRLTNESLEEVARTLFKSWFVDFDPVRAKAEGRLPSGMDAATAKLFPSEFEQSEMGAIPKGWTSAALGDWVTPLSGGTPSKSDKSLWGGDVPWISPKVMTEIHADEADEHVTPSAIGKGTRMAPLGSSLVMVRGMGLHQKVRVSQARREVTFNQDVKALVPTKIEPSLLLFALLHGQEELLGRVESSGHGTGKLPSDVLLALRITMPQRPVQERLARAFDVFNDRIAVLRDESRSLAALRDELLPKLLSGDLPIRDAERFLERSS